MGIMVGTFIGPGAIYMVLAGSLQIVFGMDIIMSLFINAIPIFGFSLACYYADAKFQLALAKLLSLFYIVMMLAVYVGVVVEIVKRGFLSAAAISAYSFFLPLLLAGLLHPEEFYCMLYMPVYLITIPSMYVLLVIYSFFNLWNVSWGTREVAQKKSQLELERERKEEEQRQADLKKKKKEGLLGTLMEQFNLGGDKGDTASVDFSIGNVLRCMCFSHEDPLEPKKQLVKIASTLDEVSKRLDKISPAGAAPGLLRRKSSYRGSIAQRKSLGSVPEQNVEQDDKTFDSVDLHDEVDDIDSSEDSAEETIYKEERDDEMNPFWIEDEDLKNGHRDY